MNNKECMTELRDKRFFIMCVGLPCSGKTNWLATELVPYLADAGIYAEMLSTEDIVDFCATATHKSYNEVFHNVIDNANKVVEARMALGSFMNMNIILDQTNLTTKSRKRKMDNLTNKDNYYKVAVKFSEELDVLNKRLEERNKTGKSISDSVFESMYSRAEEINSLEDFDDILTPEEFRLKYMPIIRKEEENASDS